MMKKEVNDATIEEILADMCYWEDMDTAILMLPTEDGGVTVMEYGGNNAATAPTLKQALIKLHTPYVQRYNVSDFDNLDWSGVLVRE